MHCALLLFVGGVLAAASAQMQVVTSYVNEDLTGVAEFRGGNRNHRPSYNDYHDYHDYHGYYGPPRRRPYYPGQYDDHRYPENHPSYAYAPNRPTNYLPNYYNYPSRNPSHYEYGSYWYPAGPGRYPDHHHHGWYDYPPRKG